MADSLEIMPSQERYQGWSWSVLIDQSYEYVRFLKQIRATNINLMKNISLLTSKDFD